MSGVVVHDEQQGPIRARLEAAGSALALFKPALRNNLIRLSLQAGGQFWLEVFLPKRFSSYAFSLGYRVSERWRKLKEFEAGVAVPFVGLTPPGGGPRAPGWRGTNPEKMSTAALDGADVRSTSTASNARMIFTIPYGHAVSQETSDMFRVIPTWEVDRIATVVGDRLQDFIDGLLPGTVEGAPFKRRRSAAPKFRLVGLGGNVRRRIFAAKRGTG